MKKDDIRYIGQVECTGENCLQLLTESFAKEHPKLVFAKIKILEVGEQYSKDFKTE